MHTEPQQLYKGRWNEIVARWLTWLSASRRICTTGRWPLAAASCSAVQPSLVVRSTPQPAAMSRETFSVEPASMSDLVGAFALGMDCGCRQPCTLKRLWH